MAANSTPKPESKHGLCGRRSNNAVAEEDRQIKRLVYIPQKLWDQCIESAELEDEKFHDWIRQSLSHSVRRSRAKSSKK